MMLPMVLPPDPPVYPLVQKIEPVATVVVTVSPSGWRADYKGQVCVWDRSLSASEVERLAGEWGRSVDQRGHTVPTPMPTPMPMQSLGVTYRPGGT